MLIKIGNRFFNHEKIKAIDIKEDQYDRVLVHFYLENDEFLSVYEKSYDFYTKMEKLRNAGLCLEFEKS